MSEITDRDQALRFAEELATTCGFNDEHTHHVTWMALKLFDGLAPLHHLGQAERFLLQVAGILHDIGWVDGYKNHHKNTLTIISRTPLLPFDNRARMIIGSIARYHEGALPSLEHDHFAALTPPDRRVVLYLASMLRLADSFDNTHRSAVEDLAVQISLEKLRVIYFSSERLKRDERAAKKGKDLMELMFKRKVNIVWALE